MELLDDKLTQGGPAAYPRFYLFGFLGRKTCCGIRFPTCPRLVAFAARARWKTRLRSAGKCPGDAEKILRLQAGTAHKRAVDVGLGREFGGVVRLHAAAILDLYLGSDRG